MTLVAAVELAVGVRVALQVMPPSPLLRLERVALGASRSALEKPVITSVKVKVTVAVSPIFRALSLMVIAEKSVGLV